MKNKKALTGRLGISAFHQEVSAIRLQRTARTVHKSLIEGLWPVSQNMPLYNC